MGRASKDAGQKYVNLYSYPGTRFLILPDWLPGLLTCTNSDNQLSLSLSLSPPFQSLPYVTINETCLLYFPGNNGTITMKHKRGLLCVSTWTYICIFLGDNNFPSIPFHVPRYPSFLPSFLSFDHAKEAKLGCQRSCDRIPVHPVSRTGTICPAAGTREVSFCLAEIRPVKLTPERADLTVTTRTS